MPNEKAVGPGLQQVMARRYHYARDAITAVRLVFGNWYSTEIAIGAAATITASVEYPEGSFTQITFSGVAQGSIPNGGMVVSDLVTLTTPIPDGAKFYTRMYQTCASGFPYNGRNGDTTNGDRIAFAASGLVDKTMTDPLNANAAANFFCSPMAIVAQTTKASIALFGDSRTFGFSDNATGTSGDSGIFARALGPTHAYINCGISGESGGVFKLTSNTNRLALSAYCSHIACGYGTNDLFSGMQSGATVYGNLSAIRALNPDKPFYQTTIPTGTTSTDSWATLNNQTPKAGEAEALALNALIVANGAGFDGVFDIEGVVNDVNGGGNRAWIPTYTPDGVHESNAANLAIAASGLIPPASFTR